VADVCFETALSIYSKIESDDDNTSAAKSPINMNWGSHLMQRRSKATEKLEANMSRQFPAVYSDLSVTDLT
jgi:hypothetical protein